MRRVQGRTEKGLKQCRECGYNLKRKAVTGRFGIAMVGTMLTYVTPLGGSAVMGIGLLLLVVTYFQNISSTEE